MKLLSIELNVKGKAFRLSLKDRPTQVAPEPSFVEVFDILEKIMAIII